MDFQLNDEQRQLADSLERVLDGQYDFESRKAIVTAGGSEPVWRTFGELGLFALPVSEDGGGFGGGAIDLLRPMALAGRALVIEPLAAQLVGCRLLDRAVAASAEPTASGWRDRLGEATSGALRVAVALPTGEQDGAIRARRGADGHWSLSGHADRIAATALGPDRLLLVAADCDADHDAEAGRRALFVLDAAGPGLELVADTGLDHQAAARLVLDGFRAPPAALLGIAPAEAGGEPAAAGLGAALEDALDFASALRSAEAVGLIEFACETTLDYLKTRKQFGVPIGSFQALQHRIVDLHVEFEQVRSMAALAASKVDAAAAGQVPPGERRRAVAAARVLIGKVAGQVARESVQLHGGMGMAEEMKVSHTFRRLTVLAREGGSVDWHLDRFLASPRPL